MSDQYPIPKRKFRALIIGAPHAPPVIEILPLLTGMGYEIMTVGTYRVPDENEPQKHDIKIHLNLFETHSDTAYFSMVKYGMMMQGVGVIKKMKLESILDVLNWDNFDFILHFEDFTLIQETEKFRIPYFYVKSEAWHPYFPKAAWKVYCGTLGVEALVKDINLSMPTATMGFSPAPCFSTKHYPIEGRKIRASFVGNLNTFNELYQERRDIVNALEKEFPEKFEAHCDGGHWNPSEVPFEQKGLGKISVAKYIQILNQTQIGVNVPTPWGCNYRDFEICATGAMLLTKRTPDHDAVGFIHKVNCWFYDTIEEAISAIKLIPEDVRAKIALAGRELITKKHNYLSRTMALLSDIHKEIRGYSSVIKGGALPLWEGNFF